MPYKLIDLFSVSGGNDVGSLIPISAAGSSQFFGESTIDQASSTPTTELRKTGLQVHPCRHRGVARLLTFNYRTDVVIGGRRAKGSALLNKKRRGDRRRVLWEPFMDVVSAVPGPRVRDGETCRSCLFRVSSPTSASDSPVRL